MKRLISLKPRNLSISGICAAQHVNRKIRLGFFHRRFSTASSPSEGKIKPHFLTKTLIYLLNYTFLTIGAGICLFIYPDPREKRMLWSPNPINHLVPQNLAEEDEDDKNYYTCEFLENPLLESILGKGYSIKTGNNNQLSTKVISSGDDHIIDLSRRHDYYLWTGGKQINQRDLPKVTVDERDMALIYSMTFELFNPTNKTNGEIPDWRLEIEVKCGNTLLFPLKFMLSHLLKSLLSLFSFCIYSCRVFFLEKLIGF